MSVNLEKINRTKKLSKIFDSFKNYFSQNLQEAIQDFWQLNFKCKLVCVSNSEKIILKDEKYFVLKISVLKNHEMLLKYSEGFVLLLLENVLGKSEENNFSLENLTQLEMKIFQAFSCDIWEKIRPYFKQEDDNSISSNRFYHLVFYAILDQKASKFVISVPIEAIEPKEIAITNEIDSNYFNDINVQAKIEVGKTKLKLADINHIEVGDIIVFENSSPEEMTLYLNNEKIKFKLHPEHSLIVEDEILGNENKEVEEMSQNIWDNLLVDMTAQFEDVKMPLGQIKQITQGEVIDIGSVYDNKIYLSVENKLIASGELIIINDRYGVQVTQILAPSNENKQQEAKSAKPKQNQNAKPAADSNQKNEKSSESEKPPENQTETAEDFDYSDFDIDDDDI